MCDGQQVVKVKDGSTTNLFTHLKTHHPAKYAEVAHVALGSKGPSKSMSKKKSSIGQPTISDALMNAKPYSQESDRYKACLNGVTRYLVSGMADTSLCLILAYNNSLNCPWVYWTVETIFIG